MNITFPRNIQNGSDLMKSGMEQYFLQNPVSGLTDGSRQYTWFGKNSTLAEYLATSNFWLSAVLLTR